MVKRYEVVKPWFGVSRGDVVETENLHPALLPNVKPLEYVNVELVVATPKAEDAAPKKRGPKPKDKDVE